jgi:predicted NUDIX family NTP pyrophosphohydrolase
MMQSAGVLLHKIANGERYVFLVHPGGPYFKNKDLGAWSIPKGEFTETETPLDAAIREFEEETGVKLAGDFTALSSVKLKSGKIVHAWALERDIDPTTIKSNTFEIEWPPKSGKRQIFPEIDRAEWFTIAEAKLKINAAQCDLIDRLADMHR